ncbi:MAG TPA: AcrB/AcrD/AcrF family protein [Terracidiphilus sp.]
MYLPASYQAALFFMLLSMLCWGSWANTRKLCPDFRFQLFYWDYALGVLLGAFVWGLTAGNHGQHGAPFLIALVSAPPRELVLAAVGGVVFNIANLLLVAAIDVAGLAVAFPVGIGMALVLGTLASYRVHPMGNPLLLFGGVLLVVVAIALDAAAYAKRESAAKAASTRGLILSVVAGILMGSFYPLVARAMQGTPMAPSTGPYAVAFFFALGVMISTFPANLLLMIFPLDGKGRVGFSGYLNAPSVWHFAGLLGGMIWCTGAVANFVASNTNFVGPAVSYSLGQGATMISACWGVFVWREFAGAPNSAKKLLVLMFFFFLVGLGAIAVAPLF